jgi:hypothetical protein
VIGWISLFLLAFIVGIICLILAVNVNLLNQFTCTSASFSRNMGIDKYMAKADENFCSLRCPCDISLTSLVKFSSVPKVFFNDWVVIPFSKNTQFQKCSSSVRNDTYYSSNATDYALSFNLNYGNSTETFNEEQFFNTWNYLEDTYKCSGFCSMSYYNEKQVNTTIYKYLFSDINKGIPDYREGCYKAIVSSTASYFSSYGSYIMILSIFMLVILINLFSYLCSSDNDDSRNIVMLNKN